MLKDLIRSDLVTVSPHTSVSMCARIMAEKGIDTLLVQGSSGRPRGIVTDRDIVVRCVATHTDVDDTTVENILSESLVVARETEGVYECIQKMHSARIRHIPVVDAEGMAIGVVSFEDMLALLSREISSLGEIGAPSAGKGSAAA